MREIDFGGGVKARLSIEASSPRGTSNEVTFTAKLVDRSGNALADTHQAAFSLHGGSFEDSQDFQNGLAQSTRSLLAGEHDMTVRVDGKPGLTDTIRVTIRGSGTKNPDFYQMFVTGPNGQKSFHMKVLANKAVCPGATGYIAIREEVGVREELKFVTGPDGLVTIPKDDKPFVYHQALHIHVVLAGMEEKEKKPQALRLAPPAPTGASRNNSRANMVLVVSVTWLLLNCFLIGTGKPIHEPFTKSATTSSHYTGRRSSYIEEAERALGVTNPKTESGRQEEPVSRVETPVSSHNEKTIFASWPLSILFFLFACAYWIASWREELGYILTEYWHWKETVDAVTEEEEPQIVTDVPKNRSGFLKSLKSSMPHVPWLVLLGTELIAELAVDIGVKGLLDFLRRGGKSQPQAGGVQ